MSRIDTIRLACGATLVVEPVENVASVAMNWLLPMGSATDPVKSDGAAAMLSELIFRGAGGLTSRQHSDAFDRLGVQRSSSVTGYHLVLSGTCLGTQLNDALPLITSMIREPALDADAVEPVRNLCLQMLDSLEDDPQHLAMLHLAEQHRPAPYNRHGHGDADALHRLSIEELRDAWNSRCVPDETIIAVAGDVGDPDALADRINQLLGDWSGTHQWPAESAEPKRGVLHIEQDTSQVHLGIACDAPAESDERSMVERLAIGVLSGGTSARLFTEVRAKRSLCYSVGASYRAGRDSGMIGLYAGTTPDRAQETMEVCLDEFQRMAAGVEVDEFDRAVIGLKSALIMHGESTASRSSSLGVDHFRLGRARTLEEVTAQIDAVSHDDVNAYLANRTYGPFTIATIGPVALKVAEAVS